MGQGWDVHRIATGRPLILGRIDIPCDFGLEGHSDADVLSHAITDALLGALAVFALLGGGPELAVLLLGDDEDHAMTRASSRSLRTSSFAASAGEPPMIWVFLPFSGT